MSGSKRNGAEGKGKRARLLGFGFGRFGQLGFGRFQGWGWGEDEAQAPSPPAREGSEGERLRGGTAKTERGKGLAFLGLRFLKFGECNLRL